MKNWLLYFFVLILILLLIPIGVSKTVSAKNTYFVKVKTDGKITEMSVEEYTLCALLAEGESLTPETKKALAVAIRSVAVYASEYGLKHEDFSLCDDAKCCIPLLAPETADAKHLEECKAAVDETYAASLTDGRKIALALFTKCAGSGTRAHADIPYLVAVTESFPCEIHTEEKTIPVSVLGLNASEDSCLVYTDNKKCAFGVFSGRLITADEIVSVVGLRSPEITLTFNGSSVRAVSKGSGHCYGLNLCGAMRMEDMGYDYDEILKLYFPTLELKKLYT